jgi:hypothetical protein
MLRTSSLLMLWLAACALVPAHLPGWASSTLQDARMVAVVLPVPAPPLPAAVQVTALRVSDLDRHGIVKFFSAKP